MSGRSDVLSASFRDPRGHVFVRDGELYRQVNEAHREDYEHLMRSGLYDALDGVRGADSARGGRSRSRVGAVGRLRAASRARALRVVPLRVELVAAARRRALHPGGAVRGARPRDDTPRRHRVQRGVSSRAPGLHRHHVARDSGTGRAMGCLPPVLPALSRATCADVVPRRAAGTVAPRVCRTGFRSIWRPGCCRAGRWRAPASRCTSECTLARSASTRTMTSPRRWAASPTGHSKGS